MQLKPLKIYKASAGSGKTYNLSLKYLELLFENSKSYRTVLAVTFTNKAAGEMKSRILIRLYELSNGDEAAKGYQEYLLNKKLARDKDDLRKKAANILSAILNDYSGFYVQTIDKFFQWVIRGFTREIGLQKSYNLELNTSSVLSEAIDLLMLGMEEDKDLREWLVRFAEDNLAEGKSWNFHSDIFKLGQEVFRESYQALQEKSKDVQKRKADFKSLREKINSEIRKFEAYLTERAEEAFSIIENAGLEVHDFSRGKSGVMSIFLKIRKHSFMKMGDLKNPRKALNAPEHWHKKKDVNEEKIVEAYHAGLNLLLKECLEHWDKNTDYFTAIALRKNIYTFGILTNISDRIMEICQERNIFLLSDSTLFLKQIIAENEAPFVFEKAGNYFSHFMLDEFQDTSRFQWQNFKPLIENSLASGNVNLLVGDVKQSIYRWRNGDWKILANELENEFANEIKEHINLDNNYRSAEEIIRFNNSLFFHASKLIRNKIDGIISKDPDEDFKKEWLGLVDSVYGEAGQNIPDGKTKNGKVCHSFFEAGNKGQYLEILGNEVPALIKDLQDRGCRAGDITLLVRTAKEGNNLAGILMDAAKLFPGYNFQVISNDSLYISNNSAVRLLIALLKYFCHASDNLNLSVLKFEYFWFLEHSDHDLHNVFRIENKINPDIYDDPVFRELEEKYEELKSLPLYELSEELIRVFSLNQNPSMFAYIQAFQDLILDYVRKESGDISSFLRFWEDKGSDTKLSLSEEQDAIRIMTIHKAKGLQFKTVIIPFCNWTLGPVSSGSKASVLWPSSEGSIYTEFPNIPVLNYSLLEKTRFSKDYYEESFRSYVDNLNLLYVATTRARNELYMFSFLKGSQTSINNTGELVYNILQQEEGEENKFPSVVLKDYFNKEKMKFEYGNTLIHKNTVNTAGEEINLKLENYPVRRKKERLSLNHKNIYLSDLQEDPSHNTGYGTQMHEIFASIYTIEDVPGALRKAWLKGLLTTAEKNRLQSEIQEKLSDSRLKKWFSAEFEVRTEAEVIDGKGEIHRPDRVMISNNRLIVLDYKFGMNKSKAYHNQLREYMDILSESGYEIISAFIWYYNLDELEEVLK